VAFYFLLAFHGAGTVRMRFRIDQFPGTFGLGVLDTAFIVPIDSIF
jgi:hypothetical protein